jgi:hypothetical protein
MSQEQNDKRAAMMAKLRKIMAIAKDGRGNENEESAALERANQLMAEYGIAEAECDISAIEAGEMEFGEVQVCPDGTVPAPGKVYRTCPTWAGVLAIGVARFTDTVVKQKVVDCGNVFAFQGEKNDVLFARWIFGVLTESIHAEQKKSGWTKRGDSILFKRAAAGTLQRRLMELAQARRSIYQKAQNDSESRAIMVVDQKKDRITEYFGVQRSQSSRYSGGNADASRAGRSAGQRINVPGAPPIGNRGGQRAIN